MTEISSVYGTPLFFILEPCAFIVVGGGGGGGRGGTEKWICVAICVILVISNLFLKNMVFVLLTHAIQINKQRNKQAILE